MDAIYTLGQASAAQVLELLPDPPSLSSVRKLILILEQRGHLSHKQEGQHFVYMPTQARQSAARSAMRQVLSTFFGGNLETASGSNAPVGSRYRALRRRGCTPVPLN